MGLWVLYIVRDLNWEVGSGKWGLGIGNWELGGIFEWMDGWMNGWVFRLGGEGIGYWVGGLVVYDG